MKIHIITLLTVCFFSVKSQVTNYVITNSMGLAYFPHKIYNSNDGNLLLSNGETNLDVGYSHILKVKPNGDTIFIKSSDSPDLFVTSTGNIITNAKDFDVATYSYATSYLTLYDRNYNKKWQLDLKDNALYVPGNINSYIKQGFDITGIFEINNNYYKLFANASLGSPFGLTYYKVSFDFDSLGNILSDCNIGPISTFEFINQSKDKVIGCMGSGISYLDMITNSWKTFDCNMPNSFTVFKTGIFINNKMYMAGVIQDQSSSYKKAIIACIDNNFNVDWCKVIIPADSAVINEFSNIINVNNKILCKYKSDTSSCLLEVDTLGQLLHSFKVDGHITNLTLLNSNVYTSRIMTSTSGSYLGLLEMDTTGNYLCAQPLSLNFSNYSLQASPLYGYPVSGSGSVSYTLTNQLAMINTYTVALSDGCDIVTGINENSIPENIFRIYPNPSNSVINVSLVENNKSTQGYTIKIVDVLGKEVINEAYKEQIDVSFLEMGIYFLSVYDRVSLIGTKKIVKE